MANKSLDIKSEPKVQAKKLPDSPKQIAIFGGGIAGLTAAQELVDRGFEVEVFEADPPSAVEAMLGAECAIGGMARTQWTRTERPSNRSDGGCVSTEPIYEFKRETITFASGTQVLTNAAKNKLNELAKLAGALTVWQDGELGLRRFRYLEIIGFRTESEPVTLDHSRTKVVENYIHGKVEFGHSIAYAGHRGGVGALPAVTVRLVVDRAPDILQFGENAHTVPEPPKPSLLYAKLKELVSLYHQGRVRALIVRGYRDAKEKEVPDDKGLKMSIDLARALAVKAALESIESDENPPYPYKLLIAAEAGGVPHADDCCIDPPQRRLAAIYVDDNWMPGEHGFRFFPAFYRHLFDTLERIPILEDRPEHVETPRSVIDNLIATKAQGLSLGARSGDDPSPTINVPRRPVRSLQELFDLMVRVLEAGGFTMTDVARINLRMFKYLTSSPERRAAEYETISWRDFMETDRFSDAFAEFLETSPRNLVALSASDADARTFGNISVQLMLDHFEDREHTDATLNGPTSVAWFLHWRRYLEHQGVVFHQAKLLGLEPVEVEVKVFDSEHPERPGPPTKETQYQLWANVLREPDEETVVQANGTKTLWSRGIPTLLLRDYFVLALPVQTAQGIVKSLINDSGFKGPFADFDALVGLGTGDPTKETPGGQIAHLSGIQYYFPTDVQCTEGHVVYSGTPWRLSSISQPQFWERQRGWWDGYRGVLSVDISDWATKYKGETAWGSTRDDIGRRVWEQIHDRIPKSDRNEIPDPIAFHLDDNIMLGADKRPILNRTPLMVERTGVYPLRPGRLASAGQTPDRSGYEVYTEPRIGKVAMAGTFMRTHTRLTTMETANESARHAVNGILAAEAFQGPRCRVWDPEQNEHPDLRYLVDLDRELHAKGLPHFLDILDLRNVPQALLRPKPHAA